LVDNLKGYGWSNIGEDILWGKYSWFIVERIWLVGYWGEYILGKI
jgi:hypothetical protein